MLCLGQRLGQQFAIDLTLQDVISMTLDTFTSDGGNGQLLSVHGGGHSGVLLGQFGIPKHRDDFGLLLQLCEQLACRATHLGVANAIDNLCFDTGHRLRLRWRRLDATHRL